MRDITGIDILIIILFFMSFAILLGLKIVSVIDRKINNISVNIPPIKVPETKVIIKESSFKENKENNAIKEGFQGSSELIKNSNKKPCEIPETKKIENVNNLKKDKIETECLTGKGYKTVYYVATDDTNSPKGYNIGEFSSFVEPQYAGVKLLPKDNEKLYPKYSNKPEQPVPNGYI
uniref:Uncharacterized protein n=1 Tax=viral metagenome TaxID=1070528 RepID=A0A6C0AD67_9ZZZZ